MRSGRLRHRLKLQSKSYTRDAYGASIAGWTTQRTVWGAVEPLSGKEYFSQGAVQAEASVRIVIRFPTGLSVDESWRVGHGSTYYDVVDALNHNEVDRMLTLMCREGVSEDTGAVYGEDALLIEIGDYLLLEGGDKLLLEA